MTDDNKRENGKHCIVFHYSEIGLKGGNRKTFEDQLMRNIQQSLSGVLKRHITRRYGRFIMDLPETFDWQAISERLKKVVGLANFVLAETLDQNFEAILESAVRQMKEIPYDSFAVVTRRVQKTFPMRSMDISKEIGAAILAERDVRVDLSNPDVSCYVDIFDDRAVVYCEKIPGLRGLPVGTGERAVSLLSSGIDSPVASWKIITRGVKLTFVHFHSAPFTSLASLNNTKRLVKHLTEYQYNSKLYAVPFLDYQQAIMMNAKPEYRVVLYRRGMYRIAELVAKKVKANALVTGESIGQVASQTLSNMRMISEVTSLPVLRPISGHDKEEIIQVARKINTFDISTEPYEDCCSLFVPKHPVTRSIPDIVYEAEEKIDLEGLLRSALDKAEVSRFKFPGDEQEQSP